MNSSEHKADSVGGSPVSIGDVLALSDVESILSLENNKNDATATATTVNVAGDALVAPTVPIPAQDVTPPVHPEFAYEDGNIELQTVDHVFWVHEFLLQKFFILAQRIKEARETCMFPGVGRLKIKSSFPSSNIVAAFRVLYAPVFPGPEARKFNSETLIKTLRVSTLYECPDMRKYAISELESRFTFLPIHRIQMSDEFNLPNWEKPAFIELCRRPESITKEEAKILGLDRLADISRIRETEQRRKFVELVDKSMASHGLGQRGPTADDKLRADAKYTLRYSSLPECDCKVQRICDDTQSNIRPSGSMSLIPKNRYSTGGVIDPRQLALQHKELKDPMLSVAPCQIHKIAPRVISESHTLLKQRNDLVRQLGDLKVAVSNQIPRGDKKDFSVEDEVSRATWVRKTS